MKHTKITEREREFINQWLKEAVAKKEIAGQCRRKENDREHHSSALERWTAQNTTRRYDLKRHVMPGPVRTRHARYCQEFAVPAGNYSGPQMRIALVPLKVPVSRVWPLF